MDAETMTVVSGEPRSGTSLMMQTLDLLGVPIVGDEYPGDAAMAARVAGAEGAESDHRQAQAAKRMERSHALNPRGFWEVSGVVMQGVRHARDDLKGKALKIITHGLYERQAPNGRWIGTPAALIDKVILCVRNPEHIGVSQKDLSGQVEIVGPSMDQWINAPQPLSPTRYIRGMGGFLLWLAEHGAENFDAITPKMLIVDYEYMHTQPASMLAEIARHLGIVPEPEQYAAALDNVDPLLRRATDFTGWPEKDAVEGVLAERIYQAVKAWDKQAICGLAAETQAIHDYHRQESVAWTDDADTWVNICPALYRQMQANVNNVHDELQKRLRAQRQGRLIPDQCKHYSRPSSQTYTVERPADLGPLTRPVVFCKRDGNATSVENCKLCWQRGSTVDGIQRPPEMQTQGAPPSGPVCDVPEPAPTVKEL